MDAHVKSVINAELQTRVQLLMDEFLANGKVKGRYSSDKELTAQQWIAESFRDKHADIREFIGKQVVAHVKEIQHRYDILFASQLITKMKDQGFIKEDIAKLLLDEKTN